MNSRELWLRERVMECVSALSHTHEIDNHNEYLSLVKDIAEELLYAATEWDKYYND